MFLYIVLYVIWAIVWGIATNKVIENKGYCENWFWWGFLFGFIAFIVALTKEDNRNPEVIYIDESKNLNADKKEVDESKILASQIDKSEKTIPDKVDVNKLVEICSYEIFNKGEKVYAKIIIKNLNDNIVSSIKIKAKGFDSFGTLIKVSGDDFFEILVQDLELKTFDVHEKIVELSNEQRDIRKLEFEVVQILLADGTIEYVEKPLWIKTCQHSLEGRYLECAHNYNCGAKYYPLISDKYWQCICGNVSIASKCSNCGMTKEGCIPFEEDKIEQTVSSYYKNKEEKEEQRLDKIYNDAINLKNSYKIYDLRENLNEAKKLFESIKDWRDSEMKIDEINHTIEQIEETKIKRKKKNTILAVIAGSLFLTLCIFGIFVIYPKVVYNKGCEYIKNENYEKALDYFSKIEGYKDSSTKIEECQNYINEIKYSEAVTYEDRGKLLQAVKEYTELGAYNDSQQRIESILSQNPILSLDTASVGDTVLFGKCSGKPIEWVLLDAEGDDTYLLISKYILFDKPYEKSRDVEIQWKECSLRDYLNETFYNNSFNADEKRFIIRSSVPSTTNSESGQWTGSTVDYVFLLSYEEVDLYFKNDSERKAKDLDGHDSSWWLRSIGRTHENGGSIESYGKIWYNGLSAWQAVGVRPVIRVQISR